MTEIVKYSLDNENIDIAVGKFIQFLEKHKTPKQEIVKNRLFLEEILTRWMDSSVGSTFTLTTGSGIGGCFASVRCMGNACNIIDKNNKDSDELVLNLVNSIEKIPSYSYEDGENVVQFRFSGQKRNKLWTIILSILIAFSIGFSIKIFLPVTIGNFILSSLINPVYDAAFRVLGFISGPLIMLSVVWGIYGIGDATTLNLVGKKLIFRFLTIMFILPVIGTTALTIFGESFSKGAESGSAFQIILEMVLGIIPSNIIEPFANGNTPQIIFVAVIFGIAMLFLDKKVSAVAELVEQINYIVEFLMNFISSMMPGFIVLVVIRIVLNDTVSSFGRIWKLFVVYVSYAVVFAVVVTLFISIRYRVSPLVIVKKNLNTFLIALSTASSAAAFSSNMETSEKKFGIDKNICSFGIPLGMVMLKSTTSLYFLFIGLFFADQYGVQISFGWVAAACMVSSMLAIATPPIPGSGVAAFTILFSRLNIPNDALAVIVSVDILFEFVRTAVNMYILPLVLIDSAASFGKLDQDVLRSWIIDEKHGILD